MGSSVRYIVVGTGGVGGTIGARLAETGREVVLVARGAHLDAMREHGLRLAMPDRSFTVRPAVAAGPEELDLTAEDVLILAVKGQDTLALLEQWSVRPVGDGAFAADVLPVVCAQNGVDNERSALRRFSRVYCMSVWLPGMLVRPGMIAGYSTPISGMLDVGLYPRGVDELAGRIAADLAASGFMARANPEVMRWKYLKLLTNLGNAVEAACGGGDDPAVQELLDLVTAEALACYRAAGIETADVTGRSPLDAIRIRPVDGVARPGCSSVQSLAKGSGSIESDYLNGEIALLGRLHGVPTPVNAYLQQVANRMAATGSAPGLIDPATLLREATGAAVAML